MINITIPTLLKNLDETKDLYTRHGSLVAVGGTVIGLAESLREKGQSLQDCFGKSFICLSLLSSIPIRYSMRLSKTSSFCSNILVDEVFGNYVE